MSFKKSLVILSLVTVVAGVLWFSSVKAQGSTGDVNVTRVGADLQTSSAPAGTTSWIDTSAPSSTNNINYLSRTTGTHIAYTSYLSGKVISVATCNYTINGTPCSATSFTTPTCDANLGYCSYQISVNSGQVTRVVWQYSSSQTSSIKVVRVGAAETTASAPSGTTGKVDSGSPDLTNPLMVTGLYPYSSHTVYVNYLLNYNIDMGYCVYDPASQSDCTGFGYSSVTCDSNVSLCYFNFGTITDGGQVTKTVWRYTPKTDNGGTAQNASTGDVQIKVVGSDLLTSSAPAGISTRADAYQLSTSNPSTFLGLVLGNHDAYATYLAGYSPVVGTCTYPRGGQECIVTNYTAASCDANTGFCMYPRSVYGSPALSVTADTVTKVVFKYDAAGSGDVRIKRVGTDLTTATAPSTQVKIDSQSLTSTNPVVFSSVSTGNTHTAYTTFPSDKRVGVGTCMYQRGDNECGVSSFSTIFDPNSPYSNQNCDINTGLCSYNNFYISNAYVTKIVFKFDTGTDTGGQDVNNSPTTSADVLITRVGANGDTSTAPSGTQANVSGYTASTTNPAFYSAISAISNTNHTISFSNVSGYTVTYATCSYQRGDIPCVPSNYQSPTCSGAWCTFNQDITSQNYVYKVIARYTLPTTADFMVMRIGSDEATTTAPGGTSVALDSTATTVSTNPGYFNGISVNGWGDSHTVYSTNISGQITTVGYCDYARGGIQCQPTNFQDASCSGLWCSVNVSTWQTDRVYKVVFRYVSPSTFDFVVQRDNEQQESTALSTSAKINGVTKTENPAWFTSMTTGQTYDVYTTYVPLSIAQIGASSCTYPRGGTPCTPSFGYANDGGVELTSRLYSSQGIIDTIAQSTNPSAENYHSDYGCSSSTGLCFRRIDAAPANYVRKVVFKYVPTGEDQTGSNTGDLKIKRVGADLYAASAPTATVKIDNVTQSGNPITRTYTEAQNPHTVTVTYPAGYTVSPGYCVYTRGSAECAVTGFNYFVSINGQATGFTWSCDDATRICTAGNLGVGNDRVLKVVFRYTAGNTGDVKVKLVGSDLTVNTAPKSVQFNVDAVATTTLNPSTYLQVPTEMHSVYAQNKTDYEISVGTCTYPRGGTECIIGDQFGSSFTPASCTDGNNCENVICSQTTGLCKYDVNVSADTVTKVVWRYEKINTQPYMLSNSGNITVNAGGSGSNTITARRQFGSNVAVTFDVSGLPSGASVSGPAGCTTDCTSNLTITTTSGTPQGTYPITVTGTPFSVTTSFNLIVNAQQTGGGGVGSSCGSNPVAVTVGSQVTWSVTPNVAGNYTYSWTGTDPVTGVGIVSLGSGQSIQVTYQTSGMKTATVTISGDGTGTCSKTINIGPKPQFIEF